MSEVTKLCENNDRCNAKQLFNVKIKTIILKTGYSFEYK